MHQDEHVLEVDLQHPIHEQRVEAAEGLHENWHSADESLHGKGPVVLRDNEALHPRSSSGSTEKMSMTLQMTRQKVVLLGQTTKRVPVSRAKTHSKATSTVAANSAWNTS